MTLVLASPAAQTWPAHTDVEPAAAVSRWARQMLLPGAAVILDTETADFSAAAQIVEVAVIDAATAEPLLVSLVNPQTPIAAEATAVHGLTAEHVAAAPTWADLLPRLARVVGDRRLLAYNAEFDRDRILGSWRAHPALTAELTRPQRWGCLMHGRSVWMRTNHRLPLAGPHRGLGDVNAAREILLAIAAGPYDFDAEPSRLGQDHPSPRKVRT